MLAEGFLQMCVTICGKFSSNESVVAGYIGRIQVKYTAKWNVQIAEKILGQALIQSEVST